MTPGALRTTVLFTLGAFGFIYEVVIDNGERPTILILVAAMMGLPTFLKIDESRRSNGKKNGDSP